MKKPVGVCDVGLLSLPHEENKDCENWREVREEVVVEQTYTLALNDEEFMFLAQQAHELDVTLNQLMVKIVAEYVDKQVAKKLS